MSSLAFQQAHIDDNRRGGIVTIIVVSLVVAYTAVSLRFFSCRLAGTSFGADDAWICISLVRKYTDPVSDT